MLSIQLAYNHSDFNTAVIWRTDSLGRILLELLSHYAFKRRLCAGLKRFLEIERNFSEASDEQHIFNKSLFDATNEALQQLMPPYKSRLTSAQARVKREEISSPEWQSILHLEVEDQVIAWCHPHQPDLNEDAAMRAMLIRDVHQVFYHLLNSFA